LKRRGRFFARTRATFLDVKSLMVVMLPPFPLPLVLLQQLLLLLFPAGFPLWRRRSL